MGENFAVVQMVVSFPQMLWEFLKKLISALVLQVGFSAVELLNVGVDAFVQQDHPVLLLLVFLV